MLRQITLALVVLLSAPAFAQNGPQQPPYQNDYLRNQQQWNRADHYPHWCRYFNREQFMSELQACGDSRHCRHDVRLKAERCGLIRPS